MLLSDSNNVITSDSDSVLIQSDIIICKIMNRSILDKINKSLTEILVLQWNLEVHQRLCLIRYLEYCLS